MNLNFYHTTTVVIALLFSIITSGQSGVIRGEVLDKKNQAAVPFASVIIQGQTKGVITDLDGQFEIEGLVPGLYNVEASFVGYKKGIAFEVEVSTARSAYIKIELEEMAVELAEAEIVGSTYSNREESPVSVRKIGANEVEKEPWWE